MATTGSELSSDEVQKVIAPESTSYWRATDAAGRNSVDPGGRSMFVDDRVAVDEVPEHGWDEFREPYSPWTGLKTAVAIAVILAMFVVYVIVRARCTPAWRHDVLLRVRRTVTSMTPSRLVRRLAKNGRDDEEDVHRQSPVVVESFGRCLQRVELELAEVVDDRLSLIHISEPTRPY